jgi:hypothetical protein
MLNVVDRYGYGQDYLVVRIDRPHNIIYGQHLKGAKTPFVDKLTPTEQNIKRGVWKQWTDLPGMPDQAPTKSEGVACKRCQEFYPYAVANQPDGTLKCWSCRSSS